MRQHVRLDAPPFVAPGGPTVPLLALLVVAWLLSQASRQEFAACGAAILVVSAFHVLRFRRRGRP